MPSSILVTGGTGMLGARIARALCAEGLQVAITYRPGDPLTAVAGLDVEHRPADLLDANALTAVVSGMDVVFHTAALVSFNPAHYNTQIRVNVEGTRSLLAAARSAGVQRFVHTSTVNTLGVPAAGALGDEKTPFDWSAYRLGYMDSKRASERLVVEEAAATDGLDTVCVLPGTMFGPGDVNVNAGAYVRLVNRAPLWLAPPGGTSVVHVDDVAQGHLLAWRQGARGRRYIMAGEPVSYGEIFRAIAEALGKRRPGFILPSMALQLPGWLGSWWNARFDLSVPFTAGTARAACSGLYYSSRRAQEELGWNARPWRDAIADSVRWLRENDLL